MMEFVCEHLHGVDYTGSVGQVRVKLDSERSRIQEANRPAKFVPHSATRDGLNIHMGTKHIYWLPLLVSRCLL